MAALMAPMDQRGRLRLAPMGTKPAMTGGAASAPSSALRSREGPLLPPGGRRVAHGALVREAGPPGAPLARTPALATTERRRSVGHGHRRLAQRPGLAVEARALVRLGL